MSCIFLFLCIGSVNAKFYHLISPIMKLSLVLLCLYTEKPNHQLSGCVSRWPIFLPVCNYRFFQGFSKLKLALLVLISFLQSITIHKLCHSLSEISCHPSHVHITSCPQSKKPKLNHTNRTNIMGIPEYIKKFLGLLHECNYIS